MSEDDDAIVSLDAYRLKRKVSDCRHPRTVLDERDGTVRCRDCDAYVSAFHVLRQIARHENEWHRRVANMRAEVAELKAWNPFLKAVKQLERLWRGKSMLPVCPHCSSGLWAEELTRSSTGVRYEVEMRRKLNIATPEGVDRNAGMRIVDGTAMGAIDDPP